MKVGKKEFVNPTVFRRHSHVEFFEATFIFNSIFFKTFCLVYFSLIWSVVTGIKGERWGAFRELNSGPLAP